MRERGVRTTLDGAGEEEGYVKVDIFVRRDVDQLTVFGMRNQKTLLKKSEPLFFADKIQYLVMYRRTIHTADILRKTNKLH